jgi:hypothetical protein
MIFIIFGAWIIAWGLRGLPLTSWAVWWYTSLCLLATFDSKKAIKKKLIFGTAATTHFLSFIAHGNRQNQGFSLL